ncbi:MAG: hypothetical protein ACI86M_001601 [Saprospiraceae bacterium]|jgi:hypothetical protein
MKYRLLLIFSLFATIVSAQLSVSVDAIPDSIYFGDEVVMNYKINVPEDVELNSLDFSPLKEIKNAAYEQDSTTFDEIMDVDILDGGKFGINDANLIITKQSAGKAIPRQGSIKIRISTIGAFLLPIPTIKTSPSDAVMPLQRKPLFVLPRGQAVELNANKSIIEEEISWKDYLKYLYGLLGVVGLILLGLYLNKKLKKADDITEEEVVEIRRPAHVIAVEDLNNLKSKQLWQNGEEKQYHTELTKIMRQYVEDRYDVQALEMTTSQLNRSMSEKGIGSNVISRFTDILQIADKVKFAKGKTGPEINEKFMGNAFETVSETKQAIVEIEKGE